MQFSIKNPISTNLILFDETSITALIKIIPPKIPYRILYVRNLKIYFTLQIFLKFIQNSYLIFNSTFSNKNSLMNFFRKIKAIYLKSCIDLIGPKVIISYIDNSSYLHFITKHSLNKYTVIAIQNGTRLIHNSKFSKNYCINDLICFGEHEKNKMTSGNCRINNYHLFGSLNASYFVTKEMIKKKPDYDLMIVSSWRGNINFEDDFWITMNSMKKADINLSAYILEKNLKAAVIFRSEKDGYHWNIRGIGTEYEYFFKIYGDRIDYLENNFSKRLIYKHMMNANLSISSGSSALLEAYGYGKKVLYINYTGTDMYHGYDDLIEIKEQSYEKLASKLNFLLKQSNEDYIKINYNNMKYYMNSSIENPTYKQAQKLIEKLYNERV